ncbi:hypothetical protein FQA39_LY00667 [Lamprigera yunnana]|nr:hypothetical protein FQA39_LY00667 [Lamprigera yunnana]
MNSLLTLDGPLTKGPIPRWQRKCLENSSVVNSTLNSSKQRSISSSNTSHNRTPKKGIEGDILRVKKTPKTPRAKPSSRSATPTPNKGAKTPSGGDRFIPTRSTTDFELGNFKLFHSTDEENLSPASKEVQRVMSENLHGIDINNQRILSYQVKAPAAPDGFQNPMRVIYTQTKTPASTKSNTRYIPNAPDRILDAPDIIDDYYLNLVDWNPNNILAVALGAHIYLWNAGTGKIEELLELDVNDYVCSVSWVQEGDFLAVGTSTGTVELWDCSQSKRLRIMDGHSARVSSLSWNSYILSSGCRSGKIIHHDVRQRNHNILILNGHTQEICGLKWSNDGKYLASGGNDNVLNIWPAASGNSYSQPQAIYTLTSHQAAVKALAWCPWQPHILASGGGTADRHIRFWNCQSGACVNAIDTKSQVCALLWSNTYKEIASGHGFANNQLILWKYPSMVKVAELTGHTSRVLHLAMSPDGSTILSAGADETLRLWKCFVKNTAKVKETGQVKPKKDKHSARDRSSSSNSSKDSASTNSGVDERIRDEKKRPAKKHKEYHSKGESSSSEEEHYKKPKLDDHKKYKKTKNNERTSYKDRVEEHYRDKRRRRDNRAMDDDKYRRNRNREHYHHYYDNNRRFNNYGNRSRDYEGDDFRRNHNQRRGGQRYRRNRSRSRSKSFDHNNARWGKEGDSTTKEKDKVSEKEKPNFGLSGKLTEERNSYRGVVIKYSEPPEARKPKRRWRLYPFKGEKALQTLYIHRESGYLIGRDRKVVDLPVDHPSCSKQHAALQYRLVTFTREDGTTGKRVRPYLIDLDSANGTFINNKKIDARKYVELLEKDVVKFGFSSREYVLLHENSKDEAEDDDVKQEEDEPSAVKKESEN